MRQFVSILRHRWWVIIGTVVLAVGGSVAYAKHQERIYQASATVFAHPSARIVKATDVNSNIGLLTYGTLAETFASLAQSQKVLGEAGAGAHLAPRVWARYSVVATNLPGTSVLQISVRGPQAATTALLANMIVRQVATEATVYFPVFGLTPLDLAATPRTAIQPQTSHDALYGGLAGVIVGFLLAALSVRLPMMLADPAPQVTQEEAGSADGNSSYSQQGGEQAAPTATHS